jgi:hypothetical protein
MKKLFCVIVTDPDDLAGMLGPVSPIIFHVECDTEDEAEEFVRENLIEECGYEEDVVEGFEIISLEVTTEDIIKL